MKLPLDHIGIAVPNIDDAIKEYQSKFGFVVDSREKLSSQQVEVCFLALANTKIELLAPLSPNSKLQKFLDSRGPGLHHLCYQVSDIKAELARLKSEGLKLIDEVPRPGAHHTQIAFIHPGSCGGVLTELCQYAISPKG